MEGQMEVEDVLYEVGGCDMEEGEPGCHRPSPSGVHNDGPEYVVSTDAVPRSTYQGASRPSAGYASVPVRLGELNDMTYELNGELLHTWCARWVLRKVRRERVIGCGWCTGHVMLGDSEIQTFKRMSQYECFTETECESPPYIVQTSVGLHSMTAVMGAVLNVEGSRSGANLCMRLQVPRPYGRKKNIHI